MCVCVCVCGCEREGEGEREREWKRDVSQCREEYQAGVSGWDGKK